MGMKAGKVTCQRGKCSCPGQADGVIFKPCMAFPSFSSKPHTPTGMKRNDDNDCNDDDDYDDDDDDDKDDDDDDNKDNKGNEVFVDYLNNHHKLHHPH